MHLPRSYKTKLEIFRTQQARLRARDLIGQLSLGQLNLLQTEDNFLFLLEDNSSFILLET
jgi:hypothetical protein